MKLFQQSTSLLLRDLPEAIKAADIAALLIDEASLGGTSIAQYLNLPFINVCSAMVIEGEDTIPPFFTTWKYNPAWWAILRNRIGYTFFRSISKPIHEEIVKYRRQWNLPLYTRSQYYSNFSKLAILSQQPPEFEYPRRQLPAWFHFTGPYSDPTARKPIDFPFDKLTDKPLIYASMGTVQNRLQNVFYSIAEACQGLDAQLVISLGAALEPEALADLPGQPLVVKYAPQLEILKRATLTITHAGMNTTLESLSNGVPMVAIPITNDQPGVAARIVWTGAGEVVPLSGLNVPKLRAAIKQVMTQTSYKKNALRLQEAIHRAGGVSRAADIVEQVISTGKPVLAQTPA
jgi:MGT family glycosyltransferase